jgi:hypothetical protein
VPLFEQININVKEKMSVCYSLYINAIVRYFFSTCEMSC